MTPELWNVIIGVVSLIVGYLLKSKFPNMPLPPIVPAPTPTPPQQPEFPLLELLWHLLREKYPNLPPLEK